MSGIVGSFINHRGSGIIAKLGSDGHSFNSGGAGVKALTETSAGFAVGDITGADALAEEPASTDEMVISDGGTLKRLDMAHMMCRPAFYADRQTAQTIGTSFEVVDLNSERFDTDACFNTTTFQFTPVIPGMYYLSAGITWKTTSDFDKGEIAIYENGSDVVAYANSPNRNYNTSICSTIINSVDSDDYFDLRAVNESGDLDISGGVPKIWMFGFRLLGGGT